MLLELRDEAEDNPENYNGDGFMLMVMVVVTMAMVDGYIMMVIVEVMMKIK